jgi:hypothetical protein
MTPTYDDTADQNDLISQVEYHADQVTATGQTIGINRESVYDNLVTAMRTVFNSAPRHALDSAAADGSTAQASNTNGYTVIPLPDDFSRFMDLRLAEWKRDVYEMVDPRSNRVRLQYNQFTKADAYNPVASKVPDPSGPSGEAIRCWPQDSGPQISRFTYVAEAAPENCPEILTEAIIMWATSYTLAAEKEQGWEIMRQAAQVILNQVEAGQQPMVQQALQQAREVTDE